jgi:SET domain-containing protein
MLLVPTELRPSPIHGVGAFLLVPVKKGDLVWRFDRRIDQLFTKDELMNLPEPAREYVLLRAPWDEKTQRFLLGGDNSRYFNHSDNPTTVAASKDAYSDSVAARDLKSGEELTSDYYDEYNNVDLLERMQLRRSKT